MIFGRKCGIFSLAGSRGRRLAGTKSASAQKCVSGGKLDILYPNPSLKQWFDALDNHSGSSTTESSTARSGSSGSKGRRGIGGGSGKNNTSNSKGLGSEAGSSDSGGGNAKTGGFIVLNEADFITVFEARDAKQVCGTLLSFPS